jgi:OOP family OmpA-OmpF porin
MNFSRVRYIFIITFIFLLKNLKGQNLIPNYSFENYISCPKNFTPNKSAFAKRVDNWYSPTKGTPDYFNKCSQYKADVPNNFAGISEAKSGNGYTGIILIYNPYIISKTEFLREYIATELKQELLKDSLYCLRFYISLGDYSKYATDEIGVYFSDKKIRKNTNLNLPVAPQIVFNGNVVDSCNEFIFWNERSTDSKTKQCKVFANDKEWDMLCSTYSANGGEKYLAIGNFEKPLGAKWVERKLKNVYSSKIFSGAYYYIDDVSFIPISSEDECNCDKVRKESEKSVEETSFEKAEEGQTIILKNIYFEFDKSELLPESYPTLDILYKALQENSLIEIEITGHTDSIGTQQYNLELSIKRAESVVNYLINKGISQSRLTFKGYGNLYPISDNTTKEGRTLNRRVEITIKKK